MKNIVLGLLLVSGFTVQGQKGKIQQAKVERIVKTLSADDMQGRRSLEPGSYKAAQFIAQEFKKIGLKPLPGLNSYEQIFSVLLTKPGKPEVKINGEWVSTERIVVGTNDSHLEWSNTDDPVEVVIIGPIDDFGKKAAAVRQKGKPALVLIHPSHLASFGHYQDYFARGGLQLASSNEKEAYVFVLTEVTEVKAYQVKVENLIDTLSMRNVVGVLPGKSRKEELVIFSGHYDHLGIVKPINGDSIANGADDDASGTTAVITLARHFKKLKNHERTLVFVAFTAEEIGGYGSKYFSQQLDPNKVMAMFNIEMIGKRSKFGANTAWITGFEETDFGKILQKNLEGSPYSFYPDPYPDQNLFYRSDNATLARQGVPAHSISTDEIDVDKLYHSVDDEFESLDTASMTNVIRAIALSATSIISGKDTPTRVNPAGLK